MGENLEISDNNSWYKITLKYDGSFKTTNYGMKNYLYGKQKSFTVDMDFYSYKDLLRDINNLRTWTEAQKISTWYMDTGSNSNPKVFLEINSDEQFLSAAWKYRDTKNLILFIISQTHNGAWKELNGSGRVAKNNSKKEGQVTINSETENVLTDMDELLENSDELAKEPDMGVGARFASAEKFKIALSHYALMNKFSVQFVKSEPTRITVQCACDSCPWRIHASVLPDRKTFQVRTTRGTHTCRAGDKLEQKVVTKSWVREMIIGWLRKEGDLPANELKRRLEEKFNAEIPYCKVWQGRKLALEQIHSKGCSGPASPAGTRRPRGRSKIATQTLVEPLEATTSQVMNTSPNKRIKLVVSKKSTWNGKIQLDSDLTDLADGAGAGNEVILESEDDTDYSEPDSQAGKKRPCGSQSTSKYRNKGVKLVVSKKRSANRRVHPDSILTDPADSAGPSDDIDVTAENFELGELDLSVGALFASASHFRFALCQYAVMNRFGVRFVKSDLSRITVRCASGSCPWRLHASVLPDKRTFQVKTATWSHTCQMSENFGHKMATKSWVCAMTIDWLRKEGDLSANELKKRLEEKFNIEIPYCKVWRGRELALEKIHGPGYRETGLPAGTKRTRGRPRNRPQTLGEPLVTRS